MLFDSHAHYTSEQFSEDLDEVLSTMKENGVGYIMNACSDISEFSDIKNIIEKYDFVYGSAGVHPHEVGRMCDADLEKIAEFLKHPKIKAIGEIGLDYYYDNSPRDTQRYWFARQLDLAVDLKMPIIIHDRDAHKDTMDILKSHNVAAIGGVFHCYTGSVEMAKEVLDMGLDIAFGGSITFKNAAKPIEVAKYVPIDKILIETDCPYLTPVPFRGKRNSSLYIHLVAEKIAEVKGLDVSEVIKKTCENAKRCFKIEEEK